MREEIKKRILRNLLEEVTKRYDHVMEENAQIIQKISHEATHDALTGLYNRSYLLKRLKKALLRCKKQKSYGAVLFIDLDNFKVINDTVGHHFGDMLLKEIAKKIQGATEAKHTLARFGGDEFVLLVEDIATRQEAETALESISKKLLETISYTYSIHQKIYQVTASIGIAVFGEDETDVNDILRHADSAMYEAKRRGKACNVFFDPSIEERLQQRLHMEMALRGGIEKEEFYLVYQPQYDFRGNIVGAEALIRWKSPEQGIVPPRDFIPFAEETGLIVPIGEWVIEHACRTLARWKESPRYRSLKLSVNCSAVEFMKGDYAGKLIEKIKHHEVDPRLLTVEITESLLMMDSEALREAMTRLNNFGVSLAIDDFGTGYSSLAYIKKFPISILKIDRSFVKDVVENPSDQTLIRAIISVAKDFGMAIIAEGIETKAQAEVLQRLGGDWLIAQGFLYGKPERLGLFEKRVRQLTETSKDR